MENYEIEEQEKLVDKLGNPLDCPHCKFDPCICDPDCWDNGDLVEEPDYE